MTDNVQGATFEILKGIQASIADLRSDMRREFGDVAQRFDDVDQRFEKLEGGLRNERRNNAGALVMMRATAGHFEERVRRLEDRVDELQRRAG